jgi:hypothetical protein
MPQPFIDSFILNGKVLTGGSDQPILKASPNGSTNKVTIRGKNFAIDAAGNFTGDLVFTCPKVSCYDASVDEARETDGWQYLDCTFTASAGFFFILFGPTVDLGVYVMNEYGFNHNNHVLAQF